MKPMTYTPLSYNGGNSMDVCIRCGSEYVNIFDPMRHGVTLQRLCRCVKYYPTPIIDPRIVKVLKGREWNNANERFPLCVSCGGVSPRYYDSVFFAVGTNHTRGHKKDCEFAALLKDLEELAT